MQTLSIYWSKSKALRWNRSTKLICLFGAAIVYFVAAHWLTMTFTPDPNFTVGPDVAGEKIRLMPPFPRREPFGFVAERPMFNDVADSDDDGHRSPIELYENGKRLGPAHSKLEDIKGLGQGRFSHLRTGRFTAIYWSASDNSDPNTNGRAYWVVKPSSQSSR
jgi:hypothetical protein